MTLPHMPNQADRAFFFHLQGLAVEWIAMRLGVTQGHAQRLVNEGRARASIKEAAE